MKKFVVSYVNFHDNTLVSKIVHAHTMLDATLQILQSAEYAESTETFKDLDHLQELMFDRDILVNAIEI